jgi:fructose-specific component phosphotransferase system IIB-like protein
MTEQTLRFRGKNKNVGAFANEIEKMLAADGYMTQSAKAPSGIIIQARKEGVLRDIFAANRAFTIQIKGKPDDFTVRIGVGKLVQNLAVTAGEALVLSELFLAVDVPEMVWTQAVKNGIAKDIDNLANSQAQAIKSSN